MAGRLNLFLVFVILKKIFYKKDFCLQFTKKYLIFFSTLCLVANCSATTLSYKDAAVVYKDSIQEKPFFVLLGIGGSYSMRTSIATNPSQWDPAIQGYTNDLGSSVLYTAGLGYNLSSLFTTDIEVTARPSYSYMQYQVPGAGASTPGFAGTKTREFDLLNTSIMANLYINGKAVKLFTHMGSKTILQPIVGLGLGIAYNTVSDFHSVQASSSVAGSNDVTSIMNSNTKSAFAWQAFLGAEAVYADTWALDLGYRYFNGGHFESNNYLTNVPSGLTSQLTVSPWSGTLRANEWFINLKYFI